MISGPEGRFQARIEASAEPTVSLDDGVVSIVAPAGPSAPVQCFVYSEPQYPASLISVLAESGLDEVALEQRWIDVGGDHAGGWPYLIGRAQYVFEAPEGRLLGDFKIAAGTLGNTSVACFHDVPGYYASFERVVRGLLSTLDSRENRERAKPSETKIMRVRIEGRLVSLMISETYKDGAGHRTESTDSMLAISQAGSLVTGDGTTIETFRRGRLVSGSYEQTKHGNSDFSLELTAKRNVHTVTGTVQDKPFTAELIVEGGLPDQARIDATACAVHKGELPSAEIGSYHPGTDPSAPYVVRFEKSKDPAGHLHKIFVRTHEEAEVTLDAACKIEKSVQRKNDITFEDERIWLEN